MSSPAPLANSPFKDHYYGTSPTQQKLLGFDRIIIDFSKKNSLELKWASNNWLIKFGEFQTYACDIGLNSSVAAKFCADKCATSTALGTIPHVEHIVFRRPIKPSIMAENLIEYAKSHQFNVVCKPKMGSGGKDVFHTETLEQLVQKVTDLFKRNKILCVCPFYEVDCEFRVIVLKGKAELAYKKVRAQVIGDGTSSVKKLIESRNLNPKLFTDIECSLDEVPKAGEKVQLTWKHDMNEGSTTEWIDISGNDAESLEAKIVNLALKGAAAVRIAFASVDIFMKKDGELIISEVNSTVGVDHLIDHHGEEGYRKIYAVYEKALTYLIASDK